MIKIFWLQFSGTPFNLASFWYPTSICHHLANSHWLISSPIQTSLWFTTPFYSETRNRNELQIPVHLDFKFLKVLFSGSLSSSGSATPLSGSRCLVCVIQVWHSLLAVRLVQIYFKGIRFDWECEKLTAMCDNLEQLEEKNLSERPTSLLVLFHSLRTWKTHFHSCHPAA